MVADERAGEAHQNRRQGRAPWPLRHLQDGRDRGAKGIVLGDSAAYCDAAGAASPGLSRSAVMRAGQQRETCVVLIEKLHLGKHRSRLNLPLWQARGAIVVNQLSAPLCRWPKRLTMPLGIQAIRGNVS